MTSALDKYAKSSVPRYTSYPTAPHFAKDFPESIYRGWLAQLDTAMAGVLLANSEYRHELEADIEPFKGLLLGLFFMSVGMGLNLALLRTQFGAIALVGCLAAWISSLTVLPAALVLTTPRALTAQTMAEEVRKKLIEMGPMYTSAAVIDLYRPLVAPPPWQFRGHWSGHQRSREPPARYFVK